MNNIDQIVSDIIALEPELGGDRARLRELVVRLLEARPEIKINSDFAARLRRELLAPASARKSAFGVGDAINKFNDYMIKLKYVLGGSAVLAALVLVAVMVGLPREKGEPGGIAPRDSGDRTGIAVVGPSAFGSLSSVSAANSSGSLESSSGVMPSAAPSGFGGGAKVMSAVAQDGTSMVGMPGPEYAPVTFKYEGGDLTPIASEMPVYRRSVGSLSKSLASSFGGRRNGMLDLSAISGSELTSVSMRHKEGEDEYWVNLDFLQGIANINLDYGMMRIEPAVCGPMGCGNGGGELVRPMPDDQLLAIANGFVEKYGVNLDLYGQPAVDTSWRDAHAPGEEPQFPEFITVTYPLVADGQTVSGWDGRPVGMQVVIDVTRRRVQNAYGIMTGAYEKSAYPMETDTARILELAQKGGMNGPLYMPVGFGEVRLGTPEVRYYQYYSYDQGARMSSELYVPALFFPVLNEKSPDAYLADFVVVPIVKEMLEERMNMLGGGGVGAPPVPMPLVR